MKKEKFFFWTATTIIALFEGVMPALTSQTELAKEGIAHLGYPEYFGNVLVVFNYFCKFLHVKDAPFLNFGNHGFHSFAMFRQAVFHGRRNCCENLPMNQLISF